MAKWMFPGFLALFWVAFPGCGSEADPGLDAGERDAGLDGATQGDPASTPDDGLDGGEDAGPVSADEAEEASDAGDPQLDAGDPAGDGAPDADSTDGGDSATDADQADGGDPEADGGVDPGLELVYEQIHLNGGMGESALVIGPDGTSVLIDTGGDGHADEILEAIDRRIGRRQLDWVIVTHYHFDHTGGFDKLFAPSSDNDDHPVEILQGVVSRGFVDMDAAFAADDSAYQQFCHLLKQDQFSGLRFDLCAGAQEASCDGEGSGDPWPASDCTGLLRGDLTDPADDQDEALSFIPLGDGARITFFHANGFLATTAGVRSAEDDGIFVGHGGTNPENGRSLGGLIRWGDFAMSFNGDMHAELEEYIVSHADSVGAPGRSQLLMSSVAMDVIHLSHHGLGSATSQAWVDWFLPDNGSHRNAVVGTNGGYFFSPASAVLGRVGERVENGYAWVTELGSLPGNDDCRRVAEGAVVIEIKDGGARYDVYALRDSVALMRETFVSTTHR